MSFYMSFPFLLFYTFFVQTHSHSFFVTHFGHNKWIVHLENVKTSVNCVCLQWPSFRILELKTVCSDFFFIYLIVSNNTQRRQKSWNKSNDKYDWITQLWHAIYLELVWLENLILFVSVSCFPIIACYCLNFK